MAQAKPGMWPWEVDGPGCRDHSLRYQGVLKSAGRTAQAAYPVPSGDTWGGREPRGRRLGDAGATGGCPGLGPAGCPELCRPCGTVPLVRAQLPRAAPPGPDTRALGAAAPHSSSPLKRFLMGPESRAPSCRPPPATLRAFFRRHKPQRAQPFLAGEVLHRSDPRWKLSSVSLQCFRAAPRWMQHSRCSPRSAEQRGRVDPVPAVCPQLMHSGHHPPSSLPKVCSWLLPSLFPTSTLRAFFCQTTLQLGGPADTGVRAVPALLQDSALLCVELHEVPVTLSFSPA